MTCVRVTSDGAGAAGASGPPPGAIVSRSAMAPVLAPGARRCQTVAATPACKISPARLPATCHPPTEAHTMGLLEDLLAGMLQGQGQAQAPGQQPMPGSQITRAQLGSLLAAVVAMLNDPRTGGLEGLIRRFQEAGLG